MKIIFLVSILFPILTFGQKLNQTKIDKFDSSIKITTSQEVLLKNYGIKQLQVEGVYTKNKEGAAYALFFIFPAPRVLSIDNKNNAILKLKNGAMLKSEWLGSYSIYSTGDNIVYGIIIEKEGLIQLKENPLTDIRFENSNSDIDFVIGDKYLDILSNISKLLLSIPE